MLFLVGQALELYRVGFVTQLDNLIYDARLELTMPRGLERRIVVVDIDEKSLAELGHWPWSRDLMATLLDKLFDPTMTIELPLIELFGRGGALKSSWYGDCLPSRDFPMLIDLYLRGKLDLDGFVTETIALDQVEEAFHRMERGEVLRSVVRL